MRKMLLVLLLSLSVTLSRAQTLIVPALYNGSSYVPITATGPSLPSSPTIYGLAGYTGSGYAVCTTSGNCGFGPGGSAPAYGAQTQVASAATVDLGAQATHNICLTGQTPVTSFGNTATVGQTYLVGFCGTPSSAPIEGGANLLLPAAGNQGTTALAYAKFKPVNGDVLNCTVTTQVSSTNTWNCEQVGAAVSRSPDGYVINANGYGTQHTRAAMARVKANTGSALFVVGPGNSIDMGAKCGTGTDLLNGGWACSWAAQVAARYSTAAMPIYDNSFAGDQGAIGAGTPYPTYDPRVTLGANWGFSVGSLFGLMAHFTNGTANNFTFAPTLAFNSIRILYVQNGLGTASVDVDGTPVGTINEGGAQALATLTITGITLATHTITIVPNNNGDLYVAVIQPYNSTVNAINLIHNGFYGATVATFDVPGAPPWNPGPMMQYIAANWAVDNFTMPLTRNDINSATAISTYYSGLTGIAGFAGANADVFFMVDPPASGDTNFADEIATAMYQASATGGTSGVPLGPVFDTGPQWINYTIANATGLESGDGIHPNKPGLSVLGDDWFRLVNTN